MLRGKQTLREARRIMTDREPGRMPRPYVIFAKEIDKPNSVPDRDRAAIISLGRSSPIGSCGLPARLATSHRCASLSGEGTPLACLALLLLGVAWPQALPPAPVSSYLTFSP